MPTASYWALESSIKYACTDLYHFVLVYTTLSVGK
jgi:hypothetical protein